MIKVLIVDDEDDIRALLTEYFLNENYLVASAKNGKEALDLIADEDFDLIVSDYLMPEQDGLSLVKCLSESDSKIPVIWISGNATQQIYRDAWKNGLFDYLEKPFRLEDLQEAVDKALAFGHIENKVILKNKGSKE